MLKGKKWTVLIGVGGALVLLLAGAGIAYAQGWEPPVDGPSFFGGCRFPGGGLFAERGFRGGHQSLVEVTAELTDLGEEAVIEALEDGQTFAQIAESAGTDPQAIIDAAVAEAESRLQEAVDSGRLTSEQMEQALDRLAKELPGRLEEPWQPAEPMKGAFGRLGHDFWTRYDAVADALGLTPEELFSELHGGKTVAEVAEAQDVDVEIVRDALEAARGELMEDAIAQAVEEGRMTQERADWLLEGLEKGFVPEAHGLGGRGGAGPRRGGHGRGMGW